jgi:hypothetical protein
MSRLDATAPEFISAGSNNDEQELLSESFDRASSDLEILRAAYPNEIVLDGQCSNEDNNDDFDHQPTWFPLIFTLSLSKGHHKFGATVTMEFPKGYPTSKSLEVISYRSSPTVKKEIIEQVVNTVKQTALEALNTYDGEECGLSCCAAAIDSWTTLIEAEQQEISVQEQAAVEAQNKERINQDDHEIHWITSEDTLIDRKSVFQAHLCIVSSEDMVKRAVNKLIEGSTKIQRATHNMVSTHKK